MANGLKIFNLKTIIWLLKAYWFYIPEVNMIIIVISPLLSSALST